MEVMVDSASQGMVRQAVTATGEIQLVVLGGLERGFHSGY